MINANQPNNDGPLFDDSPSYSPGDSVVPASEQGNPPEPVVDAPTEKDSTPGPAPASGRRRVKKTAAGSMWVGLVIGAVLLIVLPMFILQNQQETALNLFGWTWDFPVSVGMLSIAIFGALTTALIGDWRMFDLRRQIHRDDNQSPAVKPGWKAAISATSPRLMTACHPGGPSDHRGLAKSRTYP